MQNGFVESFNGRLRDECLNEHLFANLNEARQIIEEWRIDYNTNRPHTSLNGLTPTEFATRPNRGQTLKQTLLINEGKLGSRSRHIARFILIGIYTGTRAGAIAASSPYAEPGRSFVDLERGIFYRKPIGKRSTKKKRQTPAPIPLRLLAHMRRWKTKKLMATSFAEFNGKVASVKTGFRSAVRLAELSGRVTPHTLQHTAATW